MGHITNNFSITKIIILFEQKQVQIHLMINFVEIFIDLCSAKLRIMIMTIFTIQPIINYKLISNKIKLENFTFLHY